MICHFCPERDFDLFEPSDQRIPQASVETIYLEYGAQVCSFFETLGPVFLSKWIEVGAETIIVQMFEHIY